MNILLVYSFLAGLLSPLIGDVLFESMESKTKEGKIVFNKISFSQKGKVDIWEMKQSHHGFPSEKWDTIQIKVYSDKTVSYHQLNNGVEVEYKASCIRCHSNGPRLIRPNLNSKTVKNNVADKISITAMNFKIKSYGELKLKKNEPFKRKVLLVKNEIMAKKHFNPKACSQCHYDGGPRAKLSYEQLGTIKFLVKNQQMPPWPYKLTKKDKLEFGKLFYGF